MNRIQYIFILCFFSSLSFTLSAQEIKLERKDKPSSVNIGTPSSPITPAYMKEAAMEPTSVKWNIEKFNFGTIKQGEKVTQVFKFKNTGDKPLLISKVKPSCGCTTPSYSKEVVKPGGEGHIKVSFDSSGKSGLQNKSITVFLNTKERTKTLRLVGEIATP